MRSTFFSASSACIIIFLLQTFVNRFKKGSKNFRRVLTGNLREEIPRNVNTFAANTQTYIGLEMGRKINKLWGLSFLDNDTRSFLFKMHNNILGLNSRVTHFIADHSPICTFCRISLRKRGHVPSCNKTLDLVIMSFINKFLSLVLYMSCCQ
jgi:hypothetical protein